MTARSHYEVLGVATDADDKEIKAAWRAGVKASHPDHHGDDPTATDRFKAIQIAYEALSDAAKRLIYDRDQRPSPDPDHGWVWEPPPPRRPASPRPSVKPPPPRPRRPPPATPKPGPIPASWQNRGWEKPAPQQMPCVGCGDLAPLGEIRCDDCWAIYDDALTDTYEYVIGVRRLQQIQLAVRRSRRVCYAVDQAGLEERFGGLGYWNRDGLLK